MKVQDSVLEEDIIEEEFEGDINSISWEEIPSKTVNYNEYQTPSEDF